MDYTSLFHQLKAHKDIFRALLEDVDETAYRWKPQEDKWCLLEIICHLYDEEREDFRTRTRLSLEGSTTPPPSIDPVGWVKEREYINQNYQEKLKNFLRERDVSVLWLHSLKDPDWTNTSVHHNIDPRSAHLYLSNWVAHDLLHIRQITRLKYDYLRHTSGESLDYAGNWV
jgi:hypothetical protein